MTRDNDGKTEGDVIPETEMAKRRKVAQLTEDIGDLVNDLSDRMQELTDIVGLGSDLMMLLREAINNDKGKSKKLVELAKKFGNQAIADLASGKGALSDSGFTMADAMHYGNLVSPFIPQMSPSVSTEEMRSPMDKVLDRLFAEAPKLDDESQAAAVECHVVIKGMPQALYGSLSRAAEPCMMRMLTPATKRVGNRDVTVLCEQFFYTHEIASVMVERPVTSTPSSSLFVPH